MNVKSIALSAVVAVKNKPYTFGLIALQIGALVAPTATVVAALFYTSVHLTTKAGEEWRVELEAAIQKRNEEQARNGEVTDVP